MGRSLRLFTVRGIDVKIHITFPLILVFAALQFGLVSGLASGALFGVIAISILFALVTLHELGHSFAAQYYGVAVKQIVLSPIGGVAQLREMPDKPMQELVIAAAGPAVNFAVALFMVILIPILGVQIDNPMAILTGQNGFGLASLFSYIFVYNIFLALFNLIPAFPMDGGRILRALLAMRLDYVKATDLAANIGRIAAVLMGIYAILNGAFFLAFIAFFIFNAASQEAAFVRYRRSLDGYTVEQAYSPAAYSLTPSMTVRQASDLMVLGRQGSFAVVEDDTIVGFVAQADLMRALQTQPPYTPVGEIMRHDIEPSVPHDPLLEARTRMDELQLDALPVVTAGRYAGLLSRESIDRLQQIIRTAPQNAPRVQAA
jgi:stage IV sporulation protein FB